jgi:hypothetical protein
VLATIAIATILCTDVNILCISYESHRYPAFIHNSQRNVSHHHVNIPPEKTSCKITCRNDYHIVTAPHPHCSMAATSPTHKHAPNTQDNLHDQTPPPRVPLPLTHLYKLSIHELQEELKHLTRTSERIDGMRRRKDCPN